MSPDSKNEQKDEKHQNERILDQLKNEE